MNKEFTLYASIIVSLVGVLVTAFLTRQANKRQKDSIIKDLFKEFNERYGNLNDDLHYIKDNYLTLDSLRTISTNRKYLNSIYDYLDLSAEEYYWWKHKKVIDKVIWKSWHTGMVYWYNELPALREIWEEEKKAKNLVSYYLKDGEDFFKI